MWWWWWTTNHAPTVRRLRRRPGKYAALWLLSGHVLVRDFHHTKAYGWTLALRDGGWVVDTVDEHGPAAGRLEVGDRLLALNGDERVAVLGFLYFSNAPVGEIYRLDVDRHDHALADARRWR